VRTSARFPAVGRGAGHYESLYVKATRPGGGLGLWLRHTVHKRPGAEPTASLWLTLFDADAPEPIATKLTVGAERLAAPPGTYIEIADARLEPGHAVGRLATETLAASWELSYTDAYAPFRHLPYDWLYRAPLPRTKLLSPHPGARFTGRLTVGERTIELADWPGMIGHNWGAEHAERWVWIHGADFDGRGGRGYLDIGAGRIKLGPAATPWVANGALALDGEVHRLGGLDRVRSTSIEEQPTGCDFRLTGKGIVVRGSVRGERRTFVGWIYADPAGPEHNTVNCSISDLELSVERRGRPLERLAVTGGAAYELGMREADHGIPIQPFPDG
jgi:hypothetical protein